MAEQPLVHAESKSYRTLKLYRRAATRGDRRLHIKSGGRGHSKAAEFSECPVRERNDDGE